MMDAEPGLRYRMGEVYMITLLTVVGMNVLFITYIQVWVPFEKCQRKKHRRN